MIRNVFLLRATTRCAASSDACAASVKKSRDRSMEKYSTRHGAQSLFNSSG